MGIFRRFINWLKSLFGGGKKETEQFEQYVRQMQEALRNMKAQTEAVIAAQDKRRREIADCREQIAKMERYAEKAVAQGRENEAGFFLDKKKKLTAQLETLTRQAEQADGYTSQAEALYRRAESQLEEITARKDEVKAKMAAAELTQAMNCLKESQAAGSLSRMETEAQAALDKAEALAELEGRKQEEDLEALMSKYDDEALPQGSGQVKEETAGGR